MQYNTLKARIVADIYANGNEEIAGSILQGDLLAMVNAWASAGAMYGGVITPASAAPADLNQATVYLALTAGTYTNFVDGGGNPIVTTGPALITYDGGASLVFAKTDLPSGGSGATVITNDGTDGHAVAIRLTDNHSYKRSFRIDMTAEYTGGANEQRIGSLIIECYSDATDDICHGYYYGDAMSDILSEVAVYQDDVDPDFFYLMLTHESSLDSVTFAISPTDGGEVDAIITNAADDHTKVDDAAISPVGSGGGDGKMGVISQTQTWSGIGSNPRTYVMSNLVTGLIPQANIDLFEAAGATFNATSGYFELNGLTDISYEEMSDIYLTFAGDDYRRMNRKFYCVRCRTNIVAKWFGYATTSAACEDTAFTNGLAASLMEVVVLPPALGNSLFATSVISSLMYNSNYLHTIINPLKYEGSAAPSGVSLSAPSLRDFQMNSIKWNLTIPSQVFSKESLLYMINNEAATSAITITLHASVYAKCQTGGEWYSDISTALAAHTNVSLASA